MARNLALQGEMACNPALQVEMAHVFIDVIQLSQTSVSDKKIHLIW